MIIFDLLVKTISDALDTPFGKYFNKYRSNQFTPLLVHVLSSWIYK